MVAKLEKMTAEYVKENARRMKIWRLCTILSQKILPILFLYFLLSYWSAGLCHYYMVNSRIILATQLVITAIYFTIVGIASYVC